MDVIAALRNDPDVVYAEPDKIMRVQYVPNDPSYASTGSWGQSYADLYGLTAIGTTQAWDLSQGNGVVVAVVDTGVDYNHPDIAANIWTNPHEIAGNGIDDDGNGFVDDVRGWDFVGASSGSPVEDNDPIDGNGHGTHVAGTVAAVGDNNLGVVGVAWRAKVMAVKGLDDAGQGNDSELARAIIYAADNGADVINMSFGGEGESETIAEAVRYAHGLGVVLVAAAGNSSDDAANFAPANVPEALTVSALSPWGERASFSNYGSKVELAAPGVDILSLKVGTADYARMEGTSMAAPHVSGVAALVISRHPSLTNEQVRQVLRSSAADLLQSGRDPDTGCGRVSAEQAMAIQQVLEARILSPGDGLRVAGPVAIKAIVGGGDFDHYVVEYGVGRAPEQWVEMGTGTTASSRGMIATFDPAALPEGACVVRLRAYDHSGNVFSDRIEIDVCYLEFTAPMQPRIASLTSVAKPGEALTLCGSARGAAFQHYILEWAPGGAAESGWSTEGISLANSGRTVVERGTLGEWVPPAGARGYCTIRMTATDGAVQRIATTSVYVEPALVSAAWPRLVQNFGYGSSPVVVRQPAGGSRIAVEQNQGGNWTVGRETVPQVLLFEPTGGVVAADLEYGSDLPPAAGDVDGLPGDEIVVPDGPRLRLFSSDLSPLRVLGEEAGKNYSSDQVTLADLDGDGLLEILAVARDSGGGFGVGELRAYRGDGRRYSSLSPIPFATSPFGKMGVVVVDLDGDERGEIVCAYKDTESTAYKVEAFSADGSPYPGWSSRSFDAIVCEGLTAADLDGDGTVELILAEFNRTTQRGQVRVLNATGVERPGWPVSFEVNQVPGRMKVAVGETDRDHRLEIVVSTATLLQVLRADGNMTGEPQQLGDGSNFNQSSPPLISDVDGDDVPEIIVGNSTIVWEGSGYHVASIGSYTNQGLLKQSWPLFGLDGQQPYLCVPVLGDFSGTGRADLAVSTSLVYGGGMNGWLVDSVLTTLTVGPSRKANDGDWAAALHDARHTGVIPQRASAPVIVGQPSDQIGLEEEPVSFTVGAHGYPRPSFQWFRDGMAISGATSSTYTIAKVTPGDAGSYSVEATNRLGLTTSVPVTLSVRKGFVSWARNHGLAVESGNEDPDGDGLANLAEFALLRDPLVPDVASVTELHELAGQMVFRFRRPREVARVTYTVQVSADLQHWEAHRRRGDGDGHAWCGRFHRLRSPVDHGALKGTALPG